MPTACEPPVAPAIAWSPMGEPARRWGAQVRITGVAAGIVGLVLVVGGAVLVGLLRARLDESATTAARLRARDVAALAQAESLPRTLALPGEESAVIQVIDAGGDVLAASGNIDGEPPITGIRPAAGREEVATVKVLALDAAQPMRLVAMTTPTLRGPVTVVAAESLEGAASAVRSVIAVLLVTIPALVGLVATIIGFAVSTALRPVRRVSTTLAEITATDLHRRVPEPATADDIGVLAATVNDTLERLETAVERQRRFVADASHELRGPLSALRADLEVSLRHPDRTDWSSVARDTLADVERLQELTDDLLTLARVGAEPTSPASQPADLRAIVSDEVQRLARPSLVVAADVPDQPVLVSASAGHVRRLVRNVLHNASQHAAGRVDVRLELCSSGAELRIADDGPGIRPDDRARVLQPFVRLDPARTRTTAGTGLGLAIVDQIVAASHGTLTLAESASGGLLLVIWLPPAASTVPQGS